MATSLSQRRTRIVRSLSTIAYCFWWDVLVLTRQRNVRDAKEHTRTIRSRRISVSKPPPLNGQKPMRGLLGSLIGDPRSLGAGVADGRRHPPALFSYKNQVLACFRPKWPGCCPSYFKQICCRRSIITERSAVDRTFVSGRVWASRLWVRSPEPCRVFIVNNL